VNPAMQVRRRFPRMVSENPALLRRASTEGQEGFAKTKVLGLGGCALASEEAIEAGEGVEVLISIRGRVVKALGRIVYQRPREDGFRDMGVEFLWLSEEDSELLRALFTPPASVFPEV
jgi:hypothetical protein